MTTVSNLHRDIDEFDGKTTDILSDIAGRYGSDASYVPGLLEVVSGRNPRHQSAASWLIKQLVESGERLETDTVEALAAASLSFTSWEAQLHVLQIIDRVVLTDAAANDFSALAATCFHSRRPMLRAWSFDALMALAAFDERFADAAALASNAARADTAASVRARARRRGVVSRAPFRTIGGANA